MTSRRSASPILPAPLTFTSDNPLPLKSNTIASRHNANTSFSDIRDACRQLGERLRSLTSSRAGADWHLRGATGAFSAMAWRGDTPGSDAITDLLRSVAG